jgi:hypothetical protein
MSQCASATAGGGNTVFHVVTRHPILGFVGGVFVTGYALVSLCGAPAPQENCKQIIQYNGAPFCITAAKDP